MKTLIRVAAALCLAASFLSAQQAASPNTTALSIYTPFAAVPTSLTSALSVSGVATMGVASVFLVNTNASTSVTVTASCTGGTGLTFLDIVLQGVSNGNNHLSLTFPGLYCTGGVTWSASGTGVNGTISGRTY